MCTDYCTTEYSVSVSVTTEYQGFGEYSVSAEYLSDLTETEHLHFLSKLMLLKLITSD